MYVWNEWIFKLAAFKITQLVRIIQIMGGSQFGILSHMGTHTGTHPPVCTCTHTHTCTHTGTHARLTPPTSLAPHPPPAAGDLTAPPGGRASLHPTPRVFDSRVRNPGHRVWGFQSPPLQVRPRGGRTRWITSPRRSEALAPLAPPCTPAMEPGPRRLSVMRALSREAQEPVTSAPAGAAPLNFCSGPRGRVRCS